MDKLLLLGSHFDSSTFDWGKVRDLGLLDHCINMRERPVTCGNVLAHTKNQVKCFRKSLNHVASKLG